MKNQAKNQASEILLFNSFGKGKKQDVSRKGTDCVIYTRVSSKEQAENLSLSTQLKACTAYADKLKYNIVSTFGGTYESAETDERKEFTSMLTFLKKSKHMVSYILVYSLERFSRNDNSIWLSGELRRLGIEIVSVTQPIDTTNASGQMQQKLLFLFGEFDNQLRKQKCTAGIKDMLLAGDWPTKPPLGFEAIKEGRVRKIVINAKGRLLKKAFEWKAFENLSNETIRQRLSMLGLKLNHQRISELFRNPFYCGLMVHKMLEGKVAEGNQQKMVSREVFLKVNGLLDENSHGYTMNEENVEIPLKRFVKCGHCGQPLRGYIVKKKNTYYYKCNTKACGNNKNAEVLNSRFANILEVFKIDHAKDFLTLLKKQMVATFNQLSSGKHEDLQEIQKLHKEITSKINRLEQRYIEEEIGGELYGKYKSKYDLERDEIERKLMMLSSQVSNLEKCIDLAIKFATELPLKWHSGDYHTKQQLQHLLFPLGITYDKKTDECRTEEINSVFLYLAYFQQVISKKKSGIPDLCLEYSAFSGLVAPSRIELLSKV